MKDEIEKQKLDLQKRQLDVQQSQIAQNQALIDKGLPLIERFLANKIEKVDSPRFKWSAIIVGGVIVLIVAGSIWLTAQGKFGENNLQFLLGVIVGYLMTFLRDLAFPDD